MPGIYERTNGMCDKTPEIYIRMDIGRLQNGTGSLQKDIMSLREDIGNQREDVTVRLETAGRRRESTRGARN